MNHHHRSNLWNLTSNLVTTITGLFALHIIEFYDPSLPYDFLIFEYTIIDTLKETTRLLPVVKMYVCKCN